MQENNKLKNKTKSRKPKQQAFSFLTPIPKEFGGSLLPGKRKSKRPLSFKKPMHIVLKSTKAKGQFCFVNHRNRIEQVISKVSFQNQIKIFRRTVNFDHIHLVVQLSNEENYKSWIRLLPAQITEAVGSEANLFDRRPHSTIVEWGRQFENVLNYQDLNEMEVVGMRPRKV